MTQVLWIDQDAPQLVPVKRYLETSEYQLEIVATLVDAIMRINDVAKPRPDCLILDSVVQIGGQGTGFRRKISKSLEGMGRPDEPFSTESNHTGHLLFEVLPHRSYWIDRTIVLSVFDKNELTKKRGFPQEIRHYFTKSQLRETESWQAFRDALRETAMQGATRD